MMARTLRSAISMSTRTTTLVLLWSPAQLVLSGCFVDTGPSGGGGFSEEPFLDLYEPCAASSECLDADCWLVTVDYEDGSVSDALCTYQCDFDEDCDYGGYCIAVSQEPPLCFEPCLDDLDCAFGFACVVDDLGYNPVCLPW
jgi:hypothetical protein